MSRNARTTIMMNEDLFQALKVYVAVSKTENISSFINKAIYEKLVRELGEDSMFLQDVNKINIYKEYELD